jgi:FkbM family methyltransferase
MIKKSTIVKARVHLERGNFIRWAFNGMKAMALASSHPLRAIRLLSLGCVDAPCDQDWQPRWIDRWLWACEQTWKIPDVSVQEIVGQLQCLQVEQTFFYWPTSASCEGLGWIHNEIFLPSWRNPYAYESQECRIAANDLVLDIGACEGFFTLYATIKKKARVIAFEPNLEFHQSLEATIKHFKLSDQVKILGIGLSRTDHDDWFDTTEGPFQGKVNKTINSKRIKLRSLDSLFKDGEVSSVDFIKMDVEGHEESVIRGAADLIKRDRPCLAIAVYHTPTQAVEVQHAILDIDPSYNVHFRGMWLRDRGACARPATLFAWPGRKAG